MKFEVSNTINTKLIQDIKSYFDESKCSIWDKRNKIKIISFANSELTIKSFKIPHLINKIAYTFLRESKAERSYRNSLQILEFVPNPIGYAEFFKYGLLHDTYFVCEKYDYDFTIREPLTQNNFEDKENVLKQFAHFTHELHRKGVEHLDYSPGNILVKKIDELDYEFKIIDVNRMKFRKFTKQECLENFSKLWTYDDNLKIIVTEYAKLINMDTQEAYEIVLNASQKHKDKKNLKKKLLKYVRSNKIKRENIKVIQEKLKSISVVIMVRNAEETLAECLDALILFSEVIIYLNDSTDMTKNIAKKYTNVKIIEGEFSGFGMTKNIAASYSSNNWILSLDSDEIMNSELLNEIAHIDFTNLVRVYKLKRDNYFLGHKTQSCDTIIRIYNKTFTQFNDNNVHEKVYIPTNAQVVKLTNSFKHLNITNINQTLTKMIQYTDLSSENKKTCFFSVVLAKSLFAFIKTYFLKGNILKGWVGFTLGVNAANRRYYKYIKQFINCKNNL